MSLTMIPKVIGKQAQAPDIKARASRAKVPGPGVIANIKIAMKKVVDDSSDILF